MIYFWRFRISSISSWILEIRYNDNDIVISMISSWYYDSWCHIIIHVTVIHIYVLYLPYLWAYYDPYYVMIIPEGIDTTLWKSAHIPLLLYLVSYSVIHMILNYSKVWILIDYIILYVYTFYIIIHKSYNIIMSCYIYINMIWYIFHIIVIL